MTLDELQEALAQAFPGARTEIDRGELTVHVEPGDVNDVLAFAKSAMACELLADLSGVHWPAEEHVIERQMSTTGWPQYRVSRDAGVIEVLYVVRSVSQNHWFRVATAVDDQAPVLPSATAVYETANFHEREVYDFFGVEFTGHPDLTRILMPDDWLGHPQRKDYPLGGVDIPYHNDKFIPSPHERDLREVVE